jgi:Fungal trichothecene efflux pump (TRI12)
MVFNGIGAGINELTALAATSEIAPTRKRGLYVSCLIFTIIPFVPSVLYAQLIAHYSTWRYIGVICGVWAFLGVALTAAFYFPPPRVNSEGLNRAQIIKEIDWIGGFLSISGILLFIMGLQWGGYQVSSMDILTLLRPDVKVIVSLDIRSCPCSSHTRCTFDRFVLHLAKLRKKPISNVSKTATTK